jgi:hypothetical protein
MAESLVMIALVSRKLGMIGSIFKARSPTQHRVIRPAGKTIASDPRRSILCCRIRIIRTRSTLMKRTIQAPIDDPDDIQDLDTLIVDKRLGKRATAAKGRRRNRRYENRLLNAQTLDELATDGDVI